MLNKYLLRLVFLSWMKGCIAQNIQTINSCTCQTTNGSFYSLWPFRGIDKPFHSFIDVPGKRKWLYTYNPCTAITFGQDDPHAKKLCYDIGICKYAEIEKPREYFQVGVQKGVRCELNKGRIELVYKTNESSIGTTYSKVELLCDETAPFPSFEPTDEDNYIFTIRTKCACPDRCWPPAKTTTTTTTPGPEPTTPTSVVPGPKTVIPTTTSNSTKPGPKDSKLFNWELKILLPSLAGLFFVTMCYYLWQHWYRCRHCCGDYQEPPNNIIHSNNFETTEKTKLLKNEPKVTAVEHEDFEGKGKLVEPVQEEDEADKTQIVGKEDVLSLVL